MGVVWSEQHVGLGVRVAIKFAHARSGDDGARLLQEAQLVAKLNSPHIVTVSDVGLHEGIPFLVMEILDGETLAEPLRALGRLPASAVVTVCTEIARGVDEAHG